MNSLKTVLAISIVLYFEGCTAEVPRCTTPKHYQELGCKPINSHNETCPSSFDCDHLKAQDTDKCYYNGHVFESPSDLGRDQLPHCVQYASCQFGSFFTGHFDCTLPHFTSEDLENNCVLYHDHHFCCQRKICEKEEVAKLSECYMDGNRHFKGEIMTPKQDDCIECTCNESFNNATDIYKNPNCKTRDCAIEFWHLHKIRQGCVPIYYGTLKCCPSSTKCPSPTEDKVIKTNLQTSSSGLTCKFGDLELRVGDRVSHETEKCVECECKIPPMIECRLNDKCLDAE